MSRSDFSVAQFDRERDYDVIAWWWRGHGVEPLPIRSMPRLGIFTQRNGGRMAAAFAYQTNADLIIMAFPIADPTLSWRDQAEAMSHAITALHNTLQDAFPGAVIVSLTHNESAHQIYVKRAGFHGTGKVWLGVSAPADVNLDILTE